MLVFKKDGGTKLVSEDNLAFIELIKQHGWKAEETKEKTKKETKENNE
jgi:hypothetical protein